MKFTELLSIDEKKKCKKKLKEEEVETSKEKKIEEAASGAQSFIQKQLERELSKWINKSGLRISTYPDNKGIQLTVDEGKSLKSSLEVAGQRAKREIERFSPWRAIVGDVQTLGSGEQAIWIECTANITDIFSK